MSNSPTLVRRSQLGELLVSEGKLTREELAAALAYREERGLKLGQALVALHLVTQQDLAGALRSQGRVHCLHLTPGIVDPEVARLLPEALARQYVAIPVHRVAGRVTIAMEDPSEEYDVDAIAVVLGEPVFAVHADPGRVLEALAFVWSKPAAAVTPEVPRFTLVRGPLPEHDPDEAASTLVRAALREARAIGASSFHVESTARGTELSFRVEGARTPAALLSADWAAACVRVLVAFAGGATSQLRARGSLDLDGACIDLDVATLAGRHGPCARAAVRRPTERATLDDLPLEPEERATTAGWPASRGLLAVVGARGSAADGLAEDLALRAARAGRRVYRLDARGEPAEGVVHLPRGLVGETAHDLMAAAEQEPDVVETGLLEDSRAFGVAWDAARRGLLVIARVEARDAFAAAARLVAAEHDRASAAASFLGAVAVADVRLACATCRGQACPRCGGSGLDALRRVAEALDFQGALRQAIERGADSHGLRAAARALGYPTLLDRGHDLVEHGLASEAELERALRRAAGAHS